MKVGDLVQCKITKAANTLGVVTEVEWTTAPQPVSRIIHVLTGKQTHRWSEARLEIANESR